MMFETPTNRVMEKPILQIMDYAFVFAMGIELSLKILAEGLLFTPKALVKDVSGFLGKFILFIILIIRAAAANIMGNTVIESSVQCELKSGKKFQLTEKSLLPQRL